jgi:hypothetical protein
MRVSFTRTRKDRHKISQCLKHQRAEESPGFPGARDNNPRTRGRSHENAGPPPPPCHECPAFTRSPKEFVKLFALPLLLKGSRPRPASPHRPQPLSRVKLNGTRAAAHPPPNPRWPKNETAKRNEKANHNSGSSNKGSA